MIPLQFLCRNDHIFSGTLSCPHDYIADSRLNDHPRTKRARPRPVNGIIRRVHPRQVQIRSQGLLSGTVQQSVGFCMYGPADTISLSLVHIPFYSWALPQVAAVFKTSRRTIISGRNYRIVLDDHRPVLSFNAGASICKIFCSVQIRINF